ncbi:MAG: hypothetical protein ACRCYQ_13605 [Nocardioides sp.]
MRGAASRPVAVIAGLALLSSGLLGGCQRDRDDQPGDGLEPTTSATETDHTTIEDAAPGSEDRPTGSKTASDEVGESDGTGTDRETEPPTSKAGTDESGSGSGSGSTISDAEVAELEAELDEIDRLLRELESERDRG